MAQPSNSGLLGFLSKLTDMHTALYSRISGPLFKMYLQPDLGAFFEKRIWQFTDSSLLACDVVSVGKHQIFGGRHFTREAAHTDMTSVLPGIINFHTALILRDSPKCVFIFCTPLSHTMYSGFRW